MREHDADRDANRAVASYEAMQSSFYIPRLSLYRETAQDAGQPFSYCWPFVRAMAATNDLAVLPFGDHYLGDVSARLDGLGHYWDGRAGSFASYVVPPLGNGGDAYYDDNAWAGLELLRAHRLTGDPAAPEHARAVFRFLLDGWDDDLRHASPGGIYWVAANWNDDRNTVSTAPAAQLGLQLAALEDGPRDDELEWSQRMTAWVDSTLRGDDGLYADHIALDGTIDRAAWSYNQGTMIGLHTLLYEATGEAWCLAGARQVATAAQAFYTPEVLDRQGPAFNAIYLTNLARFAAIDGDPGWLDPLRQYAERLWTDRRDPASGLTTTSQPATLLDQAALVSIFAILAAEGSEPRGAG